MYSPEEILPSATMVSPFSQLAVSAGSRSARMELPTTSYIISPIRVGVRTWVFLFSARYSMFTSFFRISALVALVPIPLPLIWDRSSSSSINCPAFSMVRMMLPDVYRLGGEVSPSLIS